MSRVDAPPRSSRHRARALALQALFAIDLGRGRRDAGRPPPDPHTAFERVAAHFEAPHGAREFAWQLVKEVCAYADALDALIGRHARNWRVDRMGAVERNVLRLGAYELTHTDTPAAVVVDEAVELAHGFGSDASPPFINGVLDAIAHEVRGEPS